MTVAPELTPDPPSITEGPLPNAFPPSMKITVDVGGIDVPSHNAMTLLTAVHGDSVSGGFTARARQKRSFPSFATACVNHVSGAPAVTTAAMLPAAGLGSLGQLPGTPLPTAVSTVMWNSIECCVFMTGDTMKPTVPG
jgi:hypothetical protein